jgi:hypothetical protein
LAGDPARDPAAGDGDRAAVVDPWVVRGQSRRGHLEPIEGRGDSGEHAVEVRAARSGVGVGAPDGAVEDVEIDVEVDARDALTERVQGGVEWFGAGYDEQP